MPHNNIVSNIIDTSNQEENAAESAEEAYSEVLGSYEIPARLLEDRRKSSYNMGLNNAKGVSATITLWQLRPQRLPNGTFRMLPTSEFLDITQDFFITQCNMPHNEVALVMKTFGEQSGFLVTFGKEPYMWTFSGQLRRGIGKHDWLASFLNLYDNSLRASKLAENKQIIMLNLGTFVIRGYIMNLAVNPDSSIDDAAVPFSFNMYVREYTNTANSYTPVPTEVPLAKLQNTSVTVVPPARLEEL